LSYQEFTLVCFSQDKESRFIACVTDHSDLQLVFYDLKKGKHPITTTLESEVDKISINPDDTHTIAVTGNQVLKIFKVQESMIRPETNISKVDLEQNFTDHDWLDADNLIAGTDRGKLYIITKKNQKFGKSERLIQLSTSGLMMLSTSGIFQSAVSRPSPKVLS
jgi:hypothetical protein